MPVMRRDLNRRAVLTLLVGVVLAQALYGFLRALSLERDRPFAMAAYGADPSVDAILNFVLGGIAVVGALGLIFVQRRWLWWILTAVLVIGCADALRLSIAAYGGVSFLGLLAVRALCLYLFLTPLVRTLFGVDALSK